MKNSDTPATPTPKGILDELTHQCVTESLGLTKREHFSALAMQGLLSNSGGPIQHSPMSGFNFRNCNADDVAVLSVSIADALLNALDNQ